MSPALATLEARVESSAWPAGEIQVHRVIGREAISKPFAFEIGIVWPASAGPLDIQAAVLADAALVFVRDGEVVRKVHGILWSIEQHYEIDVEVGRRYTLRLVPRLNNLTLVVTQDILLDKSVPDIIDGTLRKYDLGDADFSLSALRGKYPKREFVVQYAESDLAFISRLAEHLGIAYAFDHAGGRDQVIFSDGNHGFVRPDAEDVLPFRTRQNESGLVDLRAKTTAIPGVYSVMDYNYRKPDLDLVGQFESSVGDAGGVIEWGTHHKGPDDAQELARIRGEEHECGRLVFEGESSLCGVSAGFRYGVEGHPDLQGQEILVTEVDHDASFATLTGHGQTEPKGYRNRFKAIPAEQTYRPPRDTPRPRIHGLIHGLVEPRSMDTVEPNPRIEGDGRYWIKFLLDSAPLLERRASHPVRRAQPAVGARYGMHFPLRPGVEVVMAFIQGDPDRPIVLGAVHNARTPAHVVTVNELRSVIETVSGVKMTFKDPTLKNK